MNRSIVAIAANTAQDVMRQGLFCLFTGGGMTLLLCSFAFTLFAFGEESRMIQEMGISTISVCCLSLASLSAANTISREAEKGTIMLLLAKPVNKYSVVLGKFFGILAAVSSVFIAMGTLLIVFLCFRESIDHHAGLLSSLALFGNTTVFRLAFSFVPVAIMCAVATAGSVYLGIIPNLCCCMTIYLIGNLTGFFHDLLPTLSNWPRLCLSSIFVFFPNLEEFSTIGLGGKIVSLSASYIGALLIHALLYIVFVITLTISFFDKKECR